MEDGPFRILIVGYGEIARLAHLPVLQSRSDSLVIGLVDTNFSEEAAVSTNDLSSGPSSSRGPLKFTSISDAFKYFGGGIHSVSICTPKTATLSVARDVLTIATSNNESKLLGIFLEKPPGEDVDDLKRIVKYGRSHGISMFTACHTAMCPARKVIDSWLFAENGVSIADNTICKRRLDSIHIIWKENIRKWHPGQIWISKESGGGVTDMLFNPLSLIVSLFGLSFLPIDLERNISGESTDRNRTISLISADLVRPCNWEAPISGHAELLMTVPLNDSVKGTVEVEVPILADFAFDYEPPPHGAMVIGEEVSVGHINGVAQVLPMPHAKASRKGEKGDYEPPDDCNKEEIWTIEFVELVSESGGSNHSCLTLKDGGAQAYIGAHRVTTDPTAEYPLRPEYEALYDQFFYLLKMNRSQSFDSAPSIIDCATLALLMEITRLGNYNIGPPFDF